MVLDRPPPFDYAPRLCVEQGDGAPKHIVEQVTRELRSQLGVTVEVQVVDRGSITTEHKTKRVLRPYKN